MPPKNYKKSELFFGITSDNGTIRKLGGGYQIFQRLIIRMNQRKNMRVVILVQRIKMLL